MKVLEPKDFQVNEWQVDYSIMSWRHLYLCGDSAVKKVSKNKTWKFLLMSITAYVNVFFQLLQDMQENFVLTGPIYAHTNSRFTGLGKHNKQGTVMVKSKFN